MEPVQTRSNRLLTCLCFVGLLMGGQYVFSQSQLDIPTSDTETMTDQQMSDQPMTDQPMSDPWPTSTPPGDELDDSAQGDEGFEQEGLGYDESLGGDAAQDDVESLPRSPDAADDELGDGFNDGSFDDGSFDDAPAGDEIMDDGTTGSDSSLGTGDGSSF